MLQINEVLNLALVAVLSPLIYLTARGTPITQRSLFFGALIAMVIAFIATVVEGLLLEDLFNLLEHAAFALAGLLFAVGLSREMNGRKDIAS